MDVGRKADWAKKQIWRSFLFGHRLVDDVGEFGGLDLGELFAPVFELLEGFDDGLGHALMGFLGAADDGELFAGGDAFMSVGVVETDTQETVA